MAVLHIPFDDALFVLSGQELELELRFLRAAKLYELGRVSVGQAGKLVGLPRLRFLDELARRGFTVIQLDEEAIEDELRDDQSEVHQ